METSSTKILATFTIGLSIPVLICYYLKKRNQYSYPNLIDFKELNRYLNENYENCLIDWCKKYPDGCTLDLKSEKSFLLKMLFKHQDDRIIILNSVDSIKEFSKNNMIADRPQLFVFNVLSKGYLGSFFRMFNEDSINIRKTSSNGLQELVLSNPNTDGLISDEFERFNTFIVKEILCSNSTGLISNAQIFFQQVIVNIIFRVGLDVRFEYEIDPKAQVKLQIGYMSTVLSALNTIELSKITRENAGSDLYSNTVQYLASIVDSLHEFITGAFFGYKKNSTPNDTIKTLLDLLLQKQRESKVDELDPKLAYSNQDIIVQLLTVFLASCGTTGFTLSWAFHYLGQYPEVVAKIFEEIKQICGETNYINFKNRSSMIYTEAVINEILRLSSTKALIPRATCNETKLNKLHIPAHTTVLLNTFGIHHNDKSWPNPHAFNPERWYNEDKKSLKQNKDCFMPFGIQPRSCIGQTLAKSLLFSIITNIINLYSIEYIKCDQSKQGNNLGVLGVFRSPFEFNLSLERRNKIN